MSSSTAIQAEPVLRTLSPLLRLLAQNLRKWLDLSHRFPITLVCRAELEGLVADLNRQAESLDSEKPHLVIMLMGGTGVGKSTLLNALAGGSIAQASFARPTTRDPVVYYHESIKPDSLDKALQECRLAAHDRPELTQKILVDTPDLDSNDLLNREILYRVLPVADIVLYVGSQEKYHDKLGWDVFQDQRQRRAFAFVLNKWDRCYHDGAAGLRPDEDLLRDLHAEGFKNPKLFRTCAQLWVDKAAENKDGAPPANGDAAPAPSVQGTSLSPSAFPEASNVVEIAKSIGHTPRPQLPEALPEGEQFTELVQWLDTGITRMEVEAIKARGISQLLEQLLKSLESVCPPDLSDVADRTRAGWERLLGEESQAVAEVLLNTLEPYQREIEHHFAVESQRRFRGLMAGYLGMFTKIKYAGNTLRDRIPFLPRPVQKVETPGTWDIATFTRACSAVAGERHLDARGRALANRLLLEADQQGFSLELITKSTETAAELDWRQRYAQTLIEILRVVEQQWSKPTGTRLWVQSSIIFLADWVPSLALLGSCVLLLWQYTMQNRSFDRGDIVLPFVVVLIVLVILHIVIAMVLPLRWPTMRGEFHRQLERRLRNELASTYSAIPSDVAEVLKQERVLVEKLIADTKEVSIWLQQREQAASITSLYGN